MEKRWVVYLLECADGTFYAGSTTDIARRLTEHNSSPKGAKYTKARRPVVLRYKKAFASRSLAQKHEAAVKKLKRAGKQELFSKR